jgi:hypothetical protein
MNTLLGQTPLAQTRLVFMVGSLLLANAAIVTSSSAPHAQAANACGCYRDDQGGCKCAKKSKCGCPEECEPVGCEEKRQKQADREADAALKKIAARERQKSADAAKQTKAAKAKAKDDKAKTAEP